jgi:hypothetical protein
MDNIHLKNTIETSIVTDHLATPLTITAPQDNIISRKSKVDGRQWLSATSNYFDSALLLLSTQGSGLFYSLRVHLLERAKLCLSCPVQWASGVGLARIQLRKTNAKTPSWSENNNN